MRPSKPTGKERQDLGVELRLEGTEADRRTTGPQRLHVATSRPDSCPPEGVEVRGQIRPWPPDPPRRSPPTFAPGSAEPGPPQRLGPCHQWPGFAEDLPSRGFLRLRAARQRLPRDRRGCWPHPRRTTAPPGTRHRRGRPARAALTGRALRPLAEAAAGQLPPEQVVLLTPLERAEAPRRARGSPGR